MAGASLQGYSIPTGSRKIKRFQRIKLALNSLEPFKILQDGRRQPTGIFNPNGITLQNPQDSEYQFLADFFYLSHAPHLHHKALTARLYKPSKISRNGPLALVTFSLIQRQLIKSEHISRITIGLHCYIYSQELT